jgi:ferredoxin--NADP+ reductase
MNYWVQGQVVEKRNWTDKLYSLRVDAPVEPFRAGQFTQLALDIEGERVGRPYSFVNGPDERPLEFHFITIPQGPLTERLQALRSGDTLWIAARPAGYFTLSEVPDARNLWLLATGTALGVFLSLLKTEELWKRFDRVVLAHGVRTADELTYRDQIAGFAELHPGRFAYVPLVTREDTDFALRARIPQAIADGRLEERAGVGLNPEESQAMICGNPDMVRDTIHVLEQRGMRRNRRSQPGHVTTEHYW